MSTRGPPNARGMNSRFAQFKLVLLGASQPDPCWSCFVFTNWRRGVCCRKGNVHLSRPAASPPEARHPRPRTTLTMTPELNSPAIRQGVYGTLLRRERPLTLAGPIRLLPRIHHRRRLPNADHRPRREHDGQVRDMGHGRPGALQVASAHVLPQRQLRRRRLRHNASRSSPTLKPDLVRKY